MESQLVDWLSRPITAAEPLNPNCKEIKRCQKCGELRTVGKSEEMILW